MTPPCLLSDIWKHLIYPKLDVCAIVQLRSTSKSFRSCPQLLALLVKSVRDWLNAHKEASKSTFNVLFGDGRRPQSDKDLSVSYFWARRAQITIQHFGGRVPGIRRMLSECIKLKSDTSQNVNTVCPEIARIVLVQGVHSFFVDLFPPVGSPYALNRETIKYYVELPANYPFAPIIVRCDSSMYHPVYSNDGTGQFSFLGAERIDWSPAITIYKLFLDISSWLDYPSGIGQSICYGIILNPDAKQTFMYSPDDFFDYVAAANAI